MIKVSVIVPAYNTEKYINNCIDSLVNQSLDAIEIIVVDDGSTDNTLQLLKEYESRYPSILKVLSKENGGQASARNLALTYAKGEFVGFVDSDDWVDINMYKEMYELAKKEQSEIVVCDMIEHYPDYEKYLDFTSVNKRLELAGSSCNKIFKRELAPEIDFPRGLWYEDFEYSGKKLMLAKKVSLIHKGFYHCNFRVGSTMHNDNSEKNVDMLTVMQNLEKFILENDLEEYKASIEYLYIDHVILQTINRLEAQKSNKKRQVIKRLRKDVLKKYPCFYRDSVFSEFTLNQKIVAVLNAYGFAKISRMLFALKTIFSVSK